MIGAGLVIVAYFTPLGLGNVATRTDTLLAGELPFIKVTALGGQRYLTLGKPTVDLECFAADEVAAEALAGRVDDLMLYHLPGQTVAGAVVQGVSSISMPSVRPYVNANVFRYGATYQLKMHDLIPVTV